MVHPLCIAHAISDIPAEKEKLLRAMILEADYSLGRNPMNMVQMTGLGSRHVDDIYTTVVTMARRASIRATRPT
jgi:hypothetical protein